MLRRWILPLIALAVLPGAMVWACPFCSAVSMTLSEEIKSADAAIVAKLVKAPPTPTEDEQAKGNFIPAEMAKGTFEVVSVLKGPASLKPGQELRILIFGQQPVGTKFLVVGTDPMDLAWGAPTELSDRASNYVTQLTRLPEGGTQRLLFFQNYLEDKDSLLAADAYDEFAKTPYAEVSQIKGQMRHDKLLEWIKSPDTSTSRRRLYLTMLGVCGSKRDLPALAAMLKDPQSRAALDALIACYLNLDGAAGMPLIEDLFLKNPKAEYTDTYAAIMALRFHGQETKAVPKERLVAGLRYMLDRPQLADLVIPDLARWQDWSVMGRLVKLFKDAKEDTVWVRVPVINYLRACPLPEAKEQIEALKKIDPEAVQRASQFFPLGAATPPAGSQRPKKKDAKSGAKPDDGAPAPPPTKNVASGNPATETAAAAPAEKAIALDPNSGDSSDNDQSAAQPAAKTAESKPAESKPAESKPADAKPAESNGASTPAAAVAKQPDVKAAKQPDVSAKGEKTAAIVAVNKPLPTGAAERVTSLDPKTPEKPQPNRVVTWSLVAAGCVLLLIAGLMRGSRRHETVSKV